MVRGFIGLGLLTGLALACSDTTEQTAADGGSSPDAGIASPSAAALPKFVDWVCAPGWKPRVVAQGTAVEHRICEPPAQKKCPAGQAQFIGQAACQRLGGQCPGTDFPSEAELRKRATGFAGAIVHVKPSATGGDGSRTKPLGTVGAALAQAGSGSIIALAAGSYPERVDVDKAVALVGACVDKTSITGSGSAAGQATITLKQGGVLLSDLRLSTASGGILIQSVKGKLSLRRLEVTGVTGFALMTAWGAPQLTLEEVVVRDTKGLALALGEGATISGTKVVFERIGGWGVLVGQAGTGTPKPSVTLNELVIRDVSEISGKDGGALRIEAPAEVKLERCLLERAANIAAVATAGGQLTLTDCSVRDTQVGTLGQGRALVVFDGSRARLTRTSVERNALTALHAWGTSPTAASPLLELVDVAVLDTAANAKTGETGCALVVAGKVTGTRVLLERSTDAAILVAADKQVPRALAIDDLAVLSTAPRPKDKLRGAALVIDGGEVTLTRAWLSKNRSHGIIAGRSSASVGRPKVTLTDLTVEDTAADGASGRYGRGLELQATDLTLRRAALRRNRDIGLLLSGDSVAELSDLVIRDTRSSPLAPFSGVGLGVQNGSSAKVARMTARGNHAAALLAIHQASQGAVKLEAEDLGLGGTGRAACAAIPEGQPNSCVKGGVTEGGGSGLALVGRVTASLKRFESHDNKLCGLQAVSGAAVTARQGELHHNAIGVNAGQGTDLNSILHGSVWVHDNDTNLDSTKLPLPSAAETFKDLGF